MRQILIITLTLALIAAMSISTVHAAGNGSSPKGKPFIAINDQIIEVKGAISSIEDQIEELVARVDTVEQRVGANETAIATLQDQNAQLEALAENNITSIADIKQYIALLQQANAAMLVQIETNSGDITALQKEIDYNTGLIRNFEGSILSINSSIISLATSLQDQIDNNNNLIGILQAQIEIIKADLALKQNIVSGFCPDGEAIKQILEDGSIICEGAGGGASGYLETVWSLRFSGDTKPGYTRSAAAHCPTGYTVTGSGFFSAFGWDIGHSYTHMNSNYKNLSKITAINRNNYTDEYCAIATCIRIAP